MDDRLVTIHLRQSELDDFRAWVNERRERFQRLLETVDSADSERRRVSATRHAGGSEADDVDVSNERGTAAKVLSVLKSNGGWMVSRQIIAELTKQHSVDIERPSLRYHLNNGLGKYYEHRGKGGASKWRAIVAK